MTTLATQFEALARAATQGTDGTYIKRATADEVALLDFITENRAQIAAALRGGEDGGGIGAEGADEGDGRSWHR